MIRCMLIDDEPLALDLLEDNLRQINYMHVIGKCRNGGEALLLLQTQQVDLIFCDIHMPGLDGLQLVKSLIKKPMIIFVTAYEKFAIDGFELEIIDYLVKPVPLERFLRACQKAYRIFELYNATAQKVSHKRPYFFLHADYNLVKINFKDIEYIEGLKDYVKINFSNQQKPVISRSSIKALELQLPDDLFYRVHKSYMVNIDHVVQLRRGKIKTLNAELPLSDNYREMIHKMIGKEID